MIQPASVRQKWSRLTIAALFPVTLVGVSLWAQPTQARQPSSVNESVTLPDGIYLYGNSPQPNQLARSYVVFERHNSEVIGAFYSPQSEFTCFAGDIRGTRLKVDALVPEEPKTLEVRAQLGNLYSLPKVSANDLRMLNVCKQETISLVTRS